VDTATFAGHDTSALRRWIVRRRLRAASHVGVGARLWGRPDIGGGGQIIIGDRFLLLSRPVRSHVYASPGAVITIGDDVKVDYGAAMAAQRAIHIGSNTMFGPFLVIMDNDFHRVGDRNAAGEVAEVRIGSNVKVGARVSILRGSIIGDSACIMSGSMVSGMVPSGATVSGVPARIVVASAAAARNSVDMAELVQGVLGLSERPRPEQGPADFAAWDSLGTLRLLLAIEETFGVNLKEEVMYSAKTIADLSAIVEARPIGSARPAIDVADLVQSVLGLPERPHPSQGPADIAAWDSLGTLRLLLAIEEMYDVSLAESDMRGGSTVAELSTIIAAKRNSAVRAEVDGGELAG
jgi:acyl carrier protein/acetyltransferase-like isoleucine patch superfamily enzyme